MLVRFSSETVDFRASRYYEAYYGWRERDIISVCFGVPLKTVTLERKQLIKTVCWVSFSLAPHLLSQLSISGGCGRKPGNRNQMILQIQKWESTIKRKNISFKCYFSVSLGGEGGYFCLPRLLALISCLAHVQLVPCRWWHWSLWAQTCSVLWGTRFGHLTVQPLCLLFSWLSSAAVLDVLSHQPALREPPRGGAALACEWMSAGWAHSPGVWGGLLAPSQPLVTMLACTTFHRLFCKSTVILAGKKKGSVVMWEGRQGWRKSIEAFWWFILLCALT